MALTNVERDEIREIVRAEVQLMVRGGAIQIDHDGVVVVADDLSPEAIERMVLEVDERLRQRDRERRVH